MSVIFVATYFVAVTHIVGCGSGLGHSLPQELGWVFESQPRQT